MTRRERQKSRQKTEFFGRLHTKNEQKRNEIKRLLRTKEAAVHFHKARLIGVQQRGRMHLLQLTDSRFVQRAKTIADSRRLNAAAS